MRLLKERFSVLSVEEFDHHLLRRERFPKGSVLLTFDDGYADNHTEARPLLEKHGMQALFYIASGYIGSGREYWWDELERLLLVNNALPQRFAFAEDRVRMSWSSDGTTATEHARIAYANQLLIMRALPSGKRDAILEELRVQLGSVVHRHTHLPMGVEEFKAFAGSPSVVVGAHTQWHPSLAQVDEPEQRAEITRSKEDLEHLLGREVKYFSYPFGTGADFNATTERISRETGFLHTAANYPGVVHARSPRHHFPRFLVRDWDGPEFRRQLDTFRRG
ncbi:MAG: polysaccharide deacetylase family protein [Flavobacteriales bacterium]|nr:polysaccharide deacetylase family protein [Flavobacteriales bacterium]